jgi:hypothetical protein
MAVHVPSIYPIRSFQAADDAGQPYIFRKTSPCLSMPLQPTRTHEALQNFPQRLEAVVRNGLNQVKDLTTSIPPSDDSFP